jgi:hypothetical protein
MKYFLSSLFFGLSVTSALVAITPTCNYIHLDYFSMFISGMCFNIALDFIIGAYKI